MTITPLPDAPLSVGLGLYTGQRQAYDGSPMYTDAIRLATVAEEAGFDAFWVSEHHGIPDGYLPDPLTVLAAIAARTERIALGTGIVIAPLAHPIRLAENAAVVDQLSNGRLILGIGLGYAAHEYRAFGVHTGRRGAALSDLVVFLRTAWTGEGFDWDGPCYRGTGLRVLPRPVRQGGVPIWLGGYAPSAVRRAAHLADGYLLGRADPPIVESIDALLRGERDPTASRFTMALNVMAVITDDPRDDESARQGLAYQQAAYETMQAGGIAHAGRVEVAAEPISAENVTSYVHTYGTSDQVAADIVTIVDRLRHWARIHLVIRALFPEQDVGVQVERIRRLGERVLPALR
jgi:probable F420-dependent oxidoreductase